MNEFDRRAALAEADLLHDLGRAQEALQTLTPALDAHPDDAQVLTMAALCHLGDDGDAVEALTLARRAAECAPGADLPHRLAALAYLRLNQTARARAAAADAVALAPTSWAAHFVLGTAHLGDVRTRRCAIDAARRAVVHAPHRWEAHQLLARAYLDGGSEPSAAEVDAAVNAIEDALRLSPGSPELMHDLARAHFQRGWTTRALAEFSGVSIHSAARTESLTALRSCLAVLTRSAAVAMTATVSVVLTVACLGVVGGQDQVASALAPWTAGAVIAVAVALGLTGVRVAVALHAGARGLWSAIRCGDTWLVATMALLGVAATAQVVAVTLPPVPAAVVLGVVAALVLSAWTCLLMRSARMRRRRSR